MEGGWLVGLGTLLDGIITGIGAFLLKMDLQRGNRRTKDQSDAYESLLGLMNRTQTQYDELRTELTRQQVTTMAAREKAVELVSEARMWQMIAEIKHKALLHASIPTDDLPEHKDYDLQVTRAENEFVTRTQQHNADLLSTEIEVTRKQLKDIKEKVAGK